MAFSAEESNRSSFGARDCMFLRGTPSWAR